MKAWYFSTADKKLRYGDNREIAVGVTHEVEGEPVLCEHGLHGSVDIIDALRYAPGPVIWRVELSGKMDKGDNKIAAQGRTYLSGGIDISETLHKFARMCALDVVHLWDAPDIVVRYLKTGDESIRAAAWAAVEAASAAAVRIASVAAARTAAWAAVEAAVRTASWARTVAAARTASVARAAAWAEAGAREGEWAASVARTGAREKQSRRLTRMVLAEIRANEGDL